MKFSEYKDICQKGDSENYILDKYIYRKISILGSITAIKLGLSPNFITFLSLISSIGSLFFLSSNESINLYIGTSLIFAYHYLDHVDGEVARYRIHNGTLQKNLRGQYFDVLCHSYSINLMLFSTAYALSNLYNSDYLILLGMISMVGYSSFPTLVASKVMIGSIYNNPENILSDSNSLLLKNLERKDLQVKATNANFFTKIKLKKLMTEIVAYPGILSVLMIATLIDAFLGEIYLHSNIINCRLIVIIGGSLMHLLHMPYKALKWMRQFEKI